MMATPPTETPTMAPVPKPDWETEPDSEGDLVVDTELSLTDVGVCVVGVVKTPRLDFEVNNTSTV